ncbi:MAG TPA: DUF1559 domain-containing protein [Armatimonadota bacterium]|jgi:prepilin-type N-terminal cleavage/methylation domain-containing protein/prepilin-type processing-associated H-X9-DG protein|nr:DUF1559 domain-containing protein [Armatimonadota bacterium]
MNARKARGFTLIELLVVIAIIAILAAILFPVFARARENARKSNCQSNLKQIGTGVMMYVQDFDEYMPFSWQISNDQNGRIWPDAILPYIKNTGVFNCPSFSTKVGLDSVGKFLRTQMPYAANTCYYGGRAGSASGPVARHPMSKPMAEIRVPADTVFATDYSGTFEAAGQYDVSSNYMQPATSTTYQSIFRHSDMCNVVFCDGHVKTLSRGALLQTHAVSGVAVKYLFTIEED